MLMILIPMSLEADIIVKKDGGTLNVFNIEVGPKYITFTKEESPDSELGRVLCDECFAIKTAEGEMTAISDFNSNGKTSSSSEPAEPTTEYSQICIPPNPAPDNMELINKYNNSIPKLRKPNKEGKTVKANDVIKALGFLESSVLSDSIVTISFEKVGVYYLDYGDEGYWGEDLSREGVYKVKVSNKSTKNIYVDMANSFRINSKGDAESFYDSKTLSHTSNNGGSVGVNLGAVTGALGVGGVLGTLASGISLGKGNSSGTVVTETQDAIVVVPPGGTITMPQRIAVSPNGKKVAKNYEKFFEVPGLKGEQNKKHFTLDALIQKLGFKLERDRFYDLKEIYEFQGTPGIPNEIKSGSLKDFLISRIITYSTDPSFNKYTSLKFDLYTRGFLGIKVDANKELMDYDEYCIIAQ